MKFTVVAVITTLFAFGLQVGVVAKPAPQLFERTVCADVWCYNPKTGATNTCDCPGSTCKRVGTSLTYTCT